MKKIMIAGINGQVGGELMRTLAPLGPIWAFDRQEMDLQDPSAICRRVREIKPDIIVNAAAYTAVDKAEVDELAAFAINAKAPGIFAEEAKKCGAIFVHYSTDYVFNGSSAIPYKETDSVGPLNAYGRTKLEGELAIQAVSGKHLILRTSWVYGMRGGNFLLTMLRLGKEKKLLKVVCDQFGAPTWSHSIADTTAKILSRTFMRQEPEEVWGTYHLTSAGQTSWFGFAEAIFDRYKNLGHGCVESPIPELLPIPSSEYPVPAKRPRYSVLSNEKLANTFQLALPDWKVALHECLGVI